mmetsp:Transcript_16214/g.27006  ORF Transcript_16214/g.27006 Transcript_16214/m.27006 type:complete len:102 (-) Transcript_16214:218-523(-)
MAAQAYRRLLVVQRQLFAQDVVNRQSARTQTREAFMMHATASADRIPALLKDANEAAEFLLRNVAQTVRNDQGNYVLKPNEHHLSYGNKPPPLPCGDSFNQ